MLSILTVQKQLQNIKNQFKERRLLLKYTQKTLSDKSGVSLGSIKRFESSGEIALKSLLKLSVVLECLEDFSALANASDVHDKAMSIVELKAAAVKSKRGSL